MARTRGGAAAATGTVVHGDPVSAQEAVPSVETTGAANAMQTPPATRKSTRRRTRAVTTQANIGQGNEKGDTPAGRNRRTGTADTPDAAGTRAGCAEGDPESVSVLPDFPAERPKKRKLACLDSSKYEQGYDSDGNMPFYYDYTDDEEDEWDECEGDDGAPEVQEEGGGNRNRGGKRKGKQRRPVIFLPPFSSRYMTSKPSRALN